MQQAAIKKPVTSPNAAFSSRSSALDLGGLRLRFGQPRGASKSRSKTFGDPRPRDAQKVVSPEKKRMQLMIGAAAIMAVIIAIL